MNDYKMFIDDEREPSTTSPHNWVICRNMDQVVETIRCAGFPEFISFDHDLGENEPTGYDIAKDMVEADLNAGGHIIPENFSFYVHSQNPVGAENISKLLLNYLKHRSPSKPLSVIDEILPYDTGEKPVTKADIDFLMEGIEPMEKANEGHGIEALHMAYVLQDMFDRYVRDSVWVHDNPDLQASVDKSGDALAQLYQDIGNSIPD